MKQLLSDFINLIYPQPEGETRKWGEIILALRVIGLVAGVMVMMGL